VRSFSAEALTAVFESLGLPGVEVNVAAGAWDSFRCDRAWTDLLAAVLHSVEVERREVGPPDVIWPDLDGAGAMTRLSARRFEMCPLAGSSAPTGFLSHGATGSRASSWSTCMSLRPFSIVASSK